MSANVVVCLRNCPAMEQCKEGRAIHSWVGHSLRFTTRCASWKNHEVMCGCRLAGMALLLLTLVGCGTPAPPPTGIIYEGKHTSEWGDIACGSDREAAIQAA